MNHEEAVFFNVDEKKLCLNELVNYFLSSGIGKRQSVVLTMISSNACSILDLGCYSGHVVAEALKLFPDKKVIGGDYVEEHVKIARALHPLLDQNSFQLLNTYDLSSIKHQFDTILFQEVIEHLEGAAHAIKEINCVLKVGGELILSTPTPYYWKDMWQSFKYELVRKYRKKDLPLSDSIYFKEHEWNRHIYCWTPSTLYTLLKVNGFEYVTHAYCQDGRGFVERLVLKIFPFLSPTIIMKVKKISEALDKIV